MGGLACCRGGWLWAMVLVVCAAGGTAVAHGSPPAPQETGGHGWVVVETGQDRRPTLLHLPPRSGPNAAPAGTVRLAVWLRDSPERLSGVGNRVYLVFSTQEGGPTGLQRRVLMMSAAPVFGGVWENQPSDRLRPLPSLPGRGTLSGFVATQLGPTALVRGAPRFPPPAVPVGDGERREDEPPPEGQQAPEAADVAEPVLPDDPFQLLLLDRGEWRGLMLPWHVQEHSAQAPGERDSVHLLQMPDGVALLIDRGSQGGADLWTGSLSRSTEVGGGPAVQWRHEPLHWERTTGPGTAEAPVGAAAVEEMTTTPQILAVDGHLVRYRFAADGDLMLEALRAGDRGGTMPMVRVESVPPRARVAAMPGAGAIAVLWPADGQGPFPAMPRGYEIREISAGSGRVLYAGEGHAGGIVASRPLQLLAVLLIAVMITVLLFILRPEARSVVALPRDSRPAEMSRRVAAAGADFLLGVVISGWLMGVAISDILGPGVVVGAQGPMPLLIALWVSFAHCTAGEWAMGRSIGKALAGCEVVSVVGGPVEVGAERVRGAVEAGEFGGRPRLWQAAARNAVRWSVPFLGVLAVVDPLGRHPGDLLGKTVVVVRERREEARDEGERGGE